MVLFEGGGCWRLARLKVSPDTSPSFLYFLSINQHSSDQAPFSSLAVLDEKFKFLNVIRLRFFDVTT